MIELWARILQDQPFNDICSDETEAVGMAELPSSSYKQALFSSLSSCFMQTRK